MGHSEELQAACPRCGYDLSGETARWVEACPVAGQCPECGLEFSWSGLFVPKVCRGLVEHAHGAVQFVRWSWVTFAWAVLPWRFWNRVKVHHAVRARRVVGAVVMIAIGVHVAAAMCFGAGVGLGLLSRGGVPVIDAAERALWQTLSTAQAGLLGTFNWPFFGLGSGPSWNASENTRVLALVMTGAVIGVAMFFGAIRMNMRWPHVRRAMVHSLWCLAIGACAGGVLTIWDGLTAFLHGGDFWRWSGRSRPFVVIAVMLLWLVAWWWQILVHRGGGADEKRGRF